MEALAALGLAGNIITFVDFTSKLISTAHTLYVSTAGVTAENAELEVLTKHIRVLADNACPLAFVQAQLGSHGANPQTPASPDALQDLAKQCRDVADELLLLLASLAVQGRHSTWKSIRSALKTAHHAPKMNAILARLDRISSQMRSHLLIRGQKNISDKLDVLEAENRRLGAARTTDIIDLRTQIQDMFTQMKTDHQDLIARNDTLALLCPSAGKVLQFTHEQQVLGALRFDGMDDRHIAIHPAHERTFSWVFGPPVQDATGITQGVGGPHGSIDFVDWLRSDDEPLYWVSGKPGSGKSTLMKYMGNHRKLKENLSAWAGTHTLVIAKYYFWDLGKDALQKSQAGLLRSVLYQILRRHPDLMQHAFSSDYDDNAPSGEPANGQVPLSVEGLLSALQRIQSGLFAAPPIKYCFLIDGLDEYQGKPVDIIRLIEILKASPHVKICVSSRPWNEFENVFGRRNSRKIYMENLTRADIERYVRDTFDRDPSFRELRDDDDGACISLIQEIVDGAKGVFLWVRLVVQSLLEGITNADRMVDLRRRMHSLPTDLEEFFTRIVFTVDPFYRQRTAHFFQVTIQAQATLPLMLYWFMDQQDPLEYAVKLEVRPLSMQATNLHLKQIRKRLNACCKGLLEVQFFDTSDISESSLSSSVLFNWKVDFLHRTARDFLRTEIMQKQLQEWTPAGSDAHMSICSAVFAQIKSAPQEEEYFSPDGPVEKLHHVFRHHALRVDDPGLEERCISLSHDLDTVVKEQMANCDLKTIWMDPKPSNANPVITMGRDFFGRIWRFW